MDQKRINSLVEFVNAFADTDIESFVDQLLLFSIDERCDTDGNYPFPKTDLWWVNELLGCFLEAEDSCGRDINLARVFWYSINDYLDSCFRENPEMSGLLEQYRNNDVWAEPQITAELQNDGDDGFNFEACWQKELKEACLAYEHMKMRGMDAEEVYAFLRQYHLASEISDAAS